MSTQLSPAGGVLTKLRDFATGAAAAAVGKSARVTVWLADKTMIVSSMIAEPPQAAARVRTQPEPPAETSSMGLTLAPLTDDLRREPGLPETVKGSW